MSKSWFYTLSIACLLLSLTDANFMAPAQALDNKLNGYYLEEKMNVLGVHKVTACASAVRIECPNTGYILISKAPLWNVIVFRPDLMKYATLSYEKWCNLNSLALNNDMFGKDKPATQDRTVEKGTKYINYYFSRIKYTGTYGIYQTEEKTKSTLQHSRVKCLDWPDDIHPGAIIGKIYGLPPLKGVPYTIESGKLGSKTFDDCELKTTKMEKRDALSASQFELPHGYKLMDFTDKLFISGRSKDVINDLLGGPGGD